MGQLSRLFVEGEMIFHFDDKSDAIAVAKDLGEDARVMAAHCRWYWVIRNVATGQMYGIREDRTYGWVNAVL